MSGALLDEDTSIGLYRHIYKCGHRDARHDAAELSLESELLNDMIEAIKSLCGQFEWAVANKSKYENLNSVLYLMEQPIANAKSLIKKATSS